MTTTTRTRTNVPDRRILVRLADGSSRIVENVPGNAKITFGALNPGKGGFGQSALRIYTSQANQLAVFVGVTEFRDLSLNVKKQVKNQAAVSRVEDDGTKVTAESAETVEAKWVSEGVF